MSKVLIPLLNGMTKRKIALLAITCATALSQNTAASDTVTDGEFDNPDWSVELTVGTGIATTAREATGGNPGAYRNATVGNDAALAGIALIYQPFSFNPACEGTLNSVTVSYTHLTLPTILRV